MRRRTRSEVVAELLRELLARGPLPAVEARRELEAAAGPLSAQLLGRARRLAGVEAVKWNGRWYWAPKGTDFSSPLVCWWCGGRFRMVVDCSAHWWPLRQVCNGCFEHLEGLDLEAERGGIRKWSGPFARRLGRRAPDRGTDG